jgi:ABC-type oligopeptide transport system ATPase subunit
VFAHPQHEYTRMLLDSVPRLHHRWREEERTPARAG